MALTFAGSTSIPLLLTMKPKSLPDLTPKVHLFGFSRNLYFLSLQTTCVNDPDVLPRCWILQSCHRHTPLFLDESYHEIALPLHVDRLLLRFSDQRALLCNKRFPRVL